MTAKLIDGKSIAGRIRSDLRAHVSKQVKLGKPAPKLAVILVGKDPASSIYVRNKHQACEEAGIETIDYSLPASVTQKKLLKLIHDLNNDATVNGILLQ